jgi:hypothetical protein
MGVGTYAAGQRIAPHAPDPAMGSVLDWPVEVGRRHGRCAKPRLAIDFVAFQGADITEGRNLEPYAKEIYAFHRTEGPRYWHGAVRALHSFLAFFGYVY